LRVCEKPLPLESISHHLNLHIILKCAILQVNYHLIRAIIPLFFEKAALGAFGRRSTCASLVASTILICRTVHYGFIFVVIVLVIIPLIKEFQFKDRSDTIVPAIMTVQYCYFYFILKN